MDWRTSQRMRPKLRFVQVKLFLSSLRKLLTFLCCTCEEGNPLAAGVTEMTIVQKTVGLAAALGASALAFALTLA